MDMEERLELERAIADIEARRDRLGDAAVDAALFGLRLRLAELDKPFPVGEETPAAGHVGERRVLTILFCDVVGSTVLAEGMDPEAWTEIMSQAFEHLIEPVNRYDGNVARLMGDGILAFFGAPTAHEDDPQRAVLAGLAILENISPLREQLKHEQGLDLNVRVGINDVLALLHHLGGKPAHVIGSSFSCAAFVWAAVEAPHSIKSLTLIGLFVRDAKPNLIMKGAYGS